MVSFRQLHSHLKRLSQNDLQGSRKEFGFKRAFATLSGQDTKIFTGTMFLNVEQLEKQLDKEDFQEIGPMAAFNVLETQFQMFITNRDYLDDEYKSIDERVQLKREYDSWVNERQMQTTEEKVDTSKALDASSVDTKSSRTESKKHDTSSRSGNAAHDDDAYIRPIYDEEPMAEVQTTAEIDVFAIGQQHTKQPEFNNEGEVVKNAEECYDTCPLPAIFTDNQMPEHSYQSLEFENSCLKKTVAQFQKDFSRLEAHCVNLELKYQNQGQQSQFLKEKSNEAKVKHDIDVIDTINIELEHKVAKLLKKNETLKKNYKELISSKNMTRFSSNDMVHNHYLEEAKKRTQERSRNSEPSLIPSARSQSTANGSNPMPRRNTQTSRNWPVTKNSFVTTKTVPIAEHPRNSRNDSCVTKFLKEVNSRAKVPSDKTTNINKPVEQTGVPHKQERQILTGHRWKPTGKIFKTVGLRWVPTGRILTSNTTNVDSEPLNGPNTDITNQYECEKTLDISACTLNLSAGTSFNSKEEGLRVCSKLRIHDHSNELSSSKLVPKVVPSASKTATSRQVLKLLFHHHITMLRHKVFRIGFSPMIQPEPERSTQGHSIVKQSLEHMSDTYVFTMKMRILLEPASNKLLVGEYSQWVERFMNYFEEQTDGEAMINSIKNGDQPLPRVTQVSIAGTTSTEQPPLKDKSMWSDQEKRVQKIDHLARSLLIQGLSNDIYSIIDNNKTAKDLWDALARHMLGSEYGEQDRKAAKCGYSKDNCELNFKFLNNLQPEWKQYATMMRLYNNLMDINIDVLYNILKQNQEDVNDAMGSKKKTVVVTFDPLALIAEKTNVSRSKEKVVVSLDSEGSEADDFSKLKKITALLAKDFNRRKFYSKPTNNNLRT
nr:Gag-Pol polyprotein [Tanacetum cinerariifolium]